MRVKIHKSYRTVVAIADSELIGKKFEEGIKQLDVRENFYGTEEMNEEQITNLIRRQMLEDATFNIVGEKSVELAIKLGISTQESILYVSKIPFTLKLL